MCQTTLTNHQYDLCDTESENQLKLLIQTINSDKYAKVSNSNSNLNTSAVSTSFSWITLASMVPGKYVL